MVGILQKVHTAKLTAPAENGRHLAKLILQTALRPRSALAANHCSGVEWVSWYEQSHEVIIFFQVLQAFYTA